MITNTNMDAKSKIHHSQNSKINENNTKPLSIENLLKNFKQKGIQPQLTAIQTIGDNIHVGSRFNACDTESNMANLRTTLDELMVLKNDAEVSDDVKSAINEVLKKIHTKCIKGAEDRDQIARTSCFAPAIPFGILNAVGRTATIVGRHLKNAVTDKNKPTPSIWAIGHKRQFSQLLEIADDVSTRNGDLQLKHPSSYITADNKTAYELQ